MLSASGMRTSKNRPGKGLSQVQQHLSGGGDLPPGLLALKLVHIRLPPSLVLALAGLAEASQNVALNIHTW